MTDRFAPVAFPVITDAALTRRAASADVRGHAAGYAAGLRAAQVETERAPGPDGRRARGPARRARRRRRRPRRPSSTAPAAGAAGPRRAGARRRRGVARQRGPSTWRRPSSCRGAGLPSDRRRRGRDRSSCRVRRGDPASCARGGRGPRRDGGPPQPADAAALDGLSLPVPVVADPSLRDGDAVVDLPDGLLDAPVDAALDPCADRPGRRPVSGSGVLELLRPRGLDEALRAARPQRVGTVTSAVGLGLTVAGLDASVGEVLTVGAEGAGQTAVEVVATDASGVRCMPLGRLTGVTAGTPVRSTGRPVLVPTGTGLFGRVLDGLGRPIDDRGPLAADDWVPLDHDTPERDGADPHRHPAAARRARARHPTTVGRGQRMGPLRGLGSASASPRCCR